MPDSRDYEDLKREELVERLIAAESVALVFGWTGSREDSDRDKALHVIWHRWYSSLPSKFAEPRSHPELSDRKLSAIARERDAVRQNAIASSRRVSATEEAR